MMDKLKILAGILMIIFVVGIVTASYQNKQTYTITITDKQVKNTKNSSYYLVFAATKDGEDLVFKNTDLLFIGKFNSSDMQGKLKNNRTYKITAVGYRVQFLSMYPNIISAEEIQE